MPVEYSIHEILIRHEPELLTEWESEQKKSIRLELIRNEDLRSQSKDFLRRFSHAIKQKNFNDIFSNEWSSVREFLTSLSVSRGIQGFSPSETALFIFTFKRPLLEKLKKEIPQDLVGSTMVWDMSYLLDKLGLFTTEVYQKSREEFINRQQQDMMELSTPVVELVEGIIALPMIGTLDSQRTQIVMETLLQRIVETKAEVAIIDITGVPTVDTLVAQHLLKTVTAARLMGTDCIISGIRPQIAATIVHLGVDLGNVITKASLAGALILALRKTGHVLSRPQNQARDTRG
jgi:rsbT co-antagonist protein RsbR